MILVQDCCDRCGHPLEPRQCKEVCPRCGARLDCSDLPSVHRPQTEDEGSMIDDG